jgi:hypothetical protein
MNESERNIETRSRLGRRSASHGTAPRPAILVTTDTRGQQQPTVATDYMLSPPTAPECVALGVLLWVSMSSAAGGAKLVPERLASWVGIMTGEAVGGAVGVILGLVPMFLAACWVGRAIHRNCGI